MKIATKKVSNSPRRVSSAHSEINLVNHIILNHRIDNKTRIDNSPGEYYQWRVKDGFSGRGGGVFSKMFQKF